MGMRKLKESKSKARSSASGKSCLSQPLVMIVEGMKAELTETPKPKKMRKKVVVCPESLMGCQRHAPRFRGYLSVQCQ
jgi:hypothetical protein